MSSISPLPESATRLISAQVVVLTPVSVVKELLDNAIDAKATSVEILVSSDTITKIEVRDNGVGIHPDDYDALGRRGYTSKLRRFEDLGTQFGKTLGFRGEALASINSVADVTITTKTSSEPVAAVLRLVPLKGGVLTQRTTSAPVGTATSVTKLFGRQPVREQMASKEAKKTLDTILELLRSYAMARPHLKILFKCLGQATKTWSYSPRRNATVAEAALQLFGTEIASNCFLKSLQVGHAEIEAEASTQKIPQHPPRFFNLDALVVNPAADFHKAIRRHYFSVDGRPINHGRGIAKRLLKIYQEHLKQSTLTSDISDCFIRLDISCPPGTYDANIEPSKDNVLFSDEQVIADAFRLLCSQTYKPVAPSHASVPMNSERDDTSATSPMVKDRNHGGDEPRAQTTLPECASRAAPKSSKTLVGEFNNDPKNREDSRDDEEARGTETSISFTPINSIHIPKRNESVCGQNRAKALTSQGVVDMSVHLNESTKRGHLLQQEMPGEILHSIENGAHDTTVHLNPWSMAKMSDSRRTNRVNDDQASGSENITQPLLTPEPPILRHTMAPPRDLDIPISQQYDINTRRLRSKVPGGPYRSPLSSPYNNSHSRGHSGPPHHRSRVTRRHGHEQPPWTPPSSAEKTRHTDGSQFHLNHLRPENNTKQTQISFGGTKSGFQQHGPRHIAPTTHVPSQNTPNELEAYGNVNLQDMFSTARQNLNYQLSRMKGTPLDEATKGNKRQSQHPPTSQRQPFSVLQTNTFKNSQPPPEIRQPIATSLPMDDPRAYLLRRQKSMAAEESGGKPRKLRRTKSSLMPLENIPPEIETHNLLVTVNIGISMVGELVRLSRKYDEYVIYGTLVDGLDMSLADGPKLESRLKRLLEQQKENIFDGELDINEITLDLQSSLKGKNIDMY